MENLDLSNIKIETVELPASFVEYLFTYFDKLDRPYTEKEMFMNTFRESFRVAKYKEHLRLEREEEVKKIKLKAVKKELPDKKEDK